MLNDEDRKYALNQHLRNISEISDREYQRRVWIKGEGPGGHDFDEVVCHFFDDGDPILKSYKDYGITKDQYNLLESFRNIFEEFSDENNWPSEFIDTPEWGKIMSMAKDVLKAFDYKKTTL